MFLLSETAFTVKLACVGSIEITLNLGQIFHNTNWIQGLYFDNYTEVTCSMVQIGNM